MKKLLQSPEEETEAHNLLWVTQDMDVSLETKAIWLQISYFYLLHSKLSFQEIFCSVRLLEPKPRAVINVANLKSELRQDFTKHSNGGLLNSGILIGLIKIHPV